MAKIDRIVNVQISLNTTAIKEKSFSDMLSLGPHVLSVGRSMIVTGPDELLDAGMQPTDPIYLAVSDAFKQIPTVNRVFIGRMLVASQTLTVAADPVAGQTYTVTLGWRDTAGVVQSDTVTYVAGSTPTPTSVATGLLAVINASDAPVNATATAGVITVSATGGATFSMTSTGSLSSPVPTSAEPAATALAAVRAENDDWYGIVLTSRVQATVLQVAEWAESNEKMFGTSVAASAAIDPASTTDLISLLKQGQYFRTNVWYHSDAGEYIEAAIMAKAFTFYPGAETWANKRLAGIAYDNLLEGQAQAVFNKNGNTFEPFRNFAITQNGRVAAGEWIDVIRFRDWLAEQCKVNVVSAIINANGGKVPYTDAGIQIIASALRVALDLGVARGGIAPPEMASDGSDTVIPSYVINVPLASSVSFNNKANRLLQDVNFTARLAGAIHTVEIKGALSYAL